MSATEISCPQCAARLAFPPGSTATRCRCSACGTVFDVTVAQQPQPLPLQPEEPPPAPPQQLVPIPVFVLPDTQPDAEEEERDHPARKRKRRVAEEDEPRSTYRQARRGNGAMIAILACVGSLVLVGVVIGGYFAFREKPKEAAKNDAPPPTPPKQPAPKTPPLTPEQMIRKVKTSAVYIRTFYREGLGTGSGFFAFKPGYVITNAHVIGYGPRDIRLPVRVEIVIDSGEATARVLPVTVHGLDVELDLALLRVDAPNLPPPLPLGKSEDLIETQEVFAFGYPFGEQLGKNISVNRTTVSSLRKANGMVEVVQLAGGLNPGNSGGPIANAKGEVVGVSVAKLRESETIAFAIPAEVAERFADDQVARGGMVRLGDLAVFAPTELEGNYLLIGIEAKDVKLGESDLKQLSAEERRFVIRGDQLLANLKGKIDPATIKLDSSQKPARIDIISSKSGVTEINYGIYKFENGILTICATEKGEMTDRPTQFKADAKSFLFVLRRLPPGK